MRIEVGDLARTEVRALLGEHLANLRADSLFLVGLAAMAGICSIIVYTLL